MKASRFITTQQYIFVWPGDELKVVGYDGNVYNMPPHDVVSEPGRGQPYSHQPAVDASGKPIPGTIVIQDRRTDNAAGGTERVLDAAEFCRWIEETLPELLNQGFAIVMKPEDVAPAMELGRPKYSKSRLNKARGILTKELERLKSAETSGIPAQISQSDHQIQWASAHLRSHQAVAGAQMMSSADIRNVLMGVPESPPEVVSEEPEPKTDVAPPVPSEVFEQAVAAGVNLTKEKMAKLLRGDVEFAAELLDEIAQKQEAERIPA